MIEPGEYILNCVHAACVGSRRPAQHDHLNTERARRRYLAVCRTAAAVLRNDDLDLVPRHQRSIIRFAEGPACRDVGHMRERQRWGHGIDAADQITVLRRGGKRPEFVAADGDKHAAAIVSDGIRCPARVADLDPAITRDGTPGRPAQGHEGHCSPTRRGGRVFRNDVRVWMCGVDQRINALGGEMIGQTLGPAKSAHADRYSVCNRRGRAASERQHHVKAGPLSETFRQLPRFRRAAEDENFSHAVS